MLHKEFVHLRVHSDYSLVDGLVNPELLVKKAVNLGMFSLALTDYSNFFGVIKFYQSAHREGIKPIIGIDLKVNNELMPGQINQLTALAVDNIGYKNLIFLISKAYSTGYDSTVGVVINRKWLLKYKQGLILLSGGCYGDIGVNLLTGNKKLLNENISFYKDNFFDFYYLEIMRTGRIKEEEYLDQVINLSIIHNIPLVATNEVCFLNREDFQAHKIRVAINKSFKINDIKFVHNYSCHQFMRSAEEMHNLFFDIPEALVNSIEIAKRCNVILNLDKYFLPNFKTGDICIEDFLIMKAKQGMKKRLYQLFPNKKIRKKVQSTYELRLDHELSVINKMGFPSYFLIVMEFIQWAKDNDIPVGPGRGSGAGSLVAYSLNITEIDPLTFDLLFERFLNPDRVSLPDFDIDFCMEKRDKVIEHVSNIYGRNTVSQIITFGTMTAKAVVRDVGRVLGYPYGFVNSISKLIPLDIGITLNKALSDETELFSLYQDNSDVKKIIDISKKLEGVTRNVSKHAGGVVISCTKITDFSPLYYDENGLNPVTQFDKNDVENVGLVKFDFLGLRTLTIIHRALNMINDRLSNMGENIIDISLIPLNDPISFRLLRTAETVGVFQLESFGMRDLIKKLQPDSFDDIVALLALFRPGPLQSGMVENYINRKKNRETISYPDIKWQHKLLKPVLKSTYGIILYQEQVMEIARVLSSYTLGEADILRRAMGKKDPLEMNKQRLIFQEGARKNGINSELAVKIFNLVEKFSGYGFNKSHSVAYAFLSYQTLWLKSNYPAEFMASAMSSDMDNVNRIVTLVNECKIMGLKIVPPTINYSKYNFYVNTKNEIVYGLGAIKGVGESSVCNILQARKKYGHFNTLLELCIRTDTKKITRRVIEKLVLSGACDCFGLNRGILIYILNNNIQASSQYLDSQLIKQSNLFKSYLDDLNICNHVLNSSYSPHIWSKRYELRHEYDTLGMYLTGHPIAQYLDEIQFYIQGNNLKNIDVNRRDNNKKIIMIAGMVTKLSIKMTKNKNRIAFFTLDDSYSKIDVIIFNDLLEKIKKILINHYILIIYGYINTKYFSNSIKFIANNVFELCQYRERCVSKLLVLLNEKQNNSIFLESLKKCLMSENLGITPVYFFYKTYKIKFKLTFSQNNCVFISNELLDKLRLLLGLNQVKLKYKII
ncbi:DNA polymerase III subunit alpha [Buchnera aphidicola (Formosaphis micheliae)]|uniref:DNA polymerase III subunit alpha n=1 Tax=Buchnera aphidicola TaxID=9 RepID=UPI0031CCCF43